MVNWMVTVSSPKFETKLHACRLDQVHKTDKRIDRIYGVEVCGALFGVETSGGTACSRSQALLRLCGLFPGSLNPAVCSRVSAVLNPPDSRTLLSPLIGRFQLTTTATQTHRFTGHCKSLHSPCCFTSLLCLSTAAL